MYLLRVTWFQRANSKNASFGQPLAKGFTMNGNMIIKHAAELVTCSGSGAKCGKAMNDLAIQSDRSLLVEEGIIKEIGAFDSLSLRKPLDRYTVIDASGKSVLPGFVDSHTHLVFGGYRPDEFSWRLRGDSYMDIMQRGGGINSTVKSTRAASREDLAASATRHLNSMLSFGVTTIEGKSGYGLDHDTEIKQLEVMQALNSTHAIDIVPTFLGAHAVPPEYAGQADAFIDFIIDAVLPEVAERQLAEFCDIFCEASVFSIEQSRRLLTKAQSCGLGIKFHADEIVQLGGAELAAELKAVSADHLLQASDAGIQQLAKTGVIATLLPGTAFSLKESYARGRFMIDQGCAVALASDFNPGSCFTESIPLIIALATLYMNLTVEEAITAFTLNGAAAISREKEIGSLDVGKQADIIILEHPSYRFIPYHIGVNSVEKVIKQGHLVVDRSHII